MDISYQVAKYLQQAGYGTVGTDIFVDYMPEQMNGLWVERSGGQMNNYVPIEETVVDIYAKNTSATAAIHLLDSIKRRIHRVNNITIDNSYMFTILVIGDVMPVSRDIEYAKIYKISVQILHRDTSLIS